jgi:hypothetical protein
VCDVCVVYTDPASLRLLLQSSDASIEFDPPPDDDDGTFEVLRSTPGSQNGMFHIRTALKGSLPATKKMNLSVILQGRQPIKRTVPVQLEAGEATRFVFADGLRNSIIKPDTTFLYTSGHELNLRLQAVDDSGNKVTAFSGQKAVVTLRVPAPAAGGCDILKEIQVDMLKGEADLTKERLFITGMPAPSTEGAEGLEGEISVKATRNAGLAGAALACMLQPGEWLSDLRLSVGGERVQDLSYEMAPDQRLLDLTVGVLAQVFLGFGGHLCCHRVL